MTDLFIMCAIEMVTGYGNWFHAYTPRLDLSNVIMKIVFRRRRHTDLSCHSDGTHHLKRQTAALDCPHWDHLPFGWILLYLMYHVPPNATHSSSPSKFNSSLFQLDFLIAGNFPLKKISVYAHSLLMCFSSLFLSLFFIVKMKQGQSQLFLTGTTQSSLSDKECRIHFTLFDNGIFSLPIWCCSYSFFYHIKYSPKYECITTFIVVSVSIRVEYFMAWR